MDTRELLYADDLMIKLLEHPDNELSRVLIEHDGDLYQITSVKKGYVIPSKDRANYLCWSEVTKEEKGAIEVIIID